jgi:hypothetical protein
MIQFINCLGVADKYKERFLDDAVKAIIVPIHRILGVDQTTHAAVRSRFHYEIDNDNDCANDPWTAVEWDGTHVTYQALLRCDARAVMKAISYLNQHPERTTCYVDDHSCKDMG